jgi:hypothetical protein
MANARGWRRGQSRANPSLARIPCLTGKIQGIGGRNRAACPLPLEKMRHGQWLTGEFRAQPNRENFALYREREPGSGKGGMPACALPSRTVMGEIVINPEDELPCLVGVTQRGRRESGTSATSMVAVAGFMCCEPSGAKPPLWMNGPSGTARPGLSSRLGHRISSPESR